MRKNQRRNNRRIRFDDEFRRLHAEFAPGDFFVRHGTGIAAIARGRIADLAEVDVYKRQAASKSASFAG